MKRTPRTTHAQPTARPRRPPLAWRPRLTWHRKLPGRSPALLAAALLLGAGVSACSGSNGEDPPPRPTPSGGGIRAESTPAADTYPGLPDSLAQQRLSWRGCQAPTPSQSAVGSRPTALPDGTRWQCATLTVPLDYDAPGGETIDIALIRVPSSAEGAGRVGSLVFNFGGPGGSGVATLPQLAAEYEGLRAGFDLVSFDPRGVGESAGVVCEDDATKDAERQDPAGPPDTVAEGRELLADQAEFAAACQLAAGELLPHVTTTNTARDLDLLRHALGDERLNYLGVSYGTELGAVHAHLFPERVGRVVLDSVVDPVSDPAQQALGQAEAFQRALETYLADCAAQGPESCPFLAGGGDGVALVTALLEQIEAQPLPTGPDQDGRKLTYGTAVLGIAASLYDEDTWQYLTAGLSEAMLLGTGSALLALADAYSGRDEQGRYTNQDDAGAAIRCADDTGSRMGTEEILRRQEEFTAASPVFGEYLLWGLASCHDWPVPGESPRPEVSAPGAAAPLLLVAITGDPATPYEGAARMRQALGGPGVAPLLTYDGEGHRAYREGNECVVRAVEAHLLRGETPADGTVCEAA